MCAPGCVVCCPSLLVFCVKVIKFHRHTTPLHAHTLCYHPTSLHAVCIFCHSLLTAPFTSNLDALSGCLGGMCSLPPPPLPTCRCPQAPSSSCLLLTTPFAVRRLVASVGVLVAFSLTGGTYLSQSEFFSSFDFNMVYAVTLLSISDLVGLATLKAGGPWSNAPTLLLCCRPVTTLGRPLLPLSRSCSGVSRARKPLAPAHALLGRYHCGQPCCPWWATVSTCHLSMVNPDLAPLGVPGWGRGRRGRAGVARLSFVESWLSVIVDVSAVPVFPNTS
jgi:hypothetical protein